MASASPPGGASTAPGGICIPCTTGQLRVEVRTENVCWDTSFYDPSPDVPLDGAEVTITLTRATGTPPPEGTLAPPTPTLTGLLGSSTFEELAPGFYSLRATKTDYEDRSSTTDIEIVAQTTATAPPLVTRNTKRECTRRHMPENPGAPSPSWLGPIFWESEPGILVLRETLLLACAAGTAVLAIIGGASGGFTSGSIAALGICAAFVGYLSVVVFGALIGVPLTLVAFLLFGGMIASALISAVASFLGLPPPDPWGFGMLAAVWAGFTFGLALGRVEPFRYKTKPDIMWEDFTYLFIAAGIGLAVAVATAILILMTVPSAAVDTGAGVGGFIAVTLGGAILGALGAFFAIAFMNDGEIRKELGDRDFLLPYEGERYCVQGHRGCISHYGHQEASYDFSLPEGAPVLCSKEGHIVAFDETREGNVRTNGNEKPNYVAVRHKDGSIAKYLHLKKNGVTRGQASHPLTAVTNRPEEGNFDHTTIDTNPLHVRAGQVLAQNGDTGISMFPHIHMFVWRKCTPPPPPPGGPPPADRWEHLAFRFRDADVQSHGGQCYSMRKYRSDNVNRGPVQVPGAAPAPPTPPAPPAPPAPPPTLPPLPPGASIA